MEAKTDTLERRDGLREALRTGCSVARNGAGCVSASNPVRMRLSDLQWLLLDAPPILAHGYVWSYEWSRVISGVYDVTLVLAGRAGKQRQIVSAPS